MQSHYRKNLVFSWENLANAKSAYDKLVEKVAGLLPAEIEVKDAKAFEEGKRRFTDALDNDLNTSLAVTALYDVFKLDTDNSTKLALIEDFERVLCLGVLEEAKKVKTDAPASADDGIDAELKSYIENMIEMRVRAKKEKNFAEADRIREELLSRGVTLIDTREGTKYTVS